MLFRSPIKVDEFICEISQRFTGEIHQDKETNLIYSTDASSYKELPQAVLIPKTEQDLKLLVLQANKHSIPLIMRAAGTSLAGQVVGNGVIVDISKYFRNIIEINAQEKWCIVEPGVVLDELNQVLQQYGLMFAPETSTSNRCMIGGMVGNNSCGAHSLIYGSTREHVVEIEAILSDGSKTIFKDIDENFFKNKCSQNTLEGKIYRYINEIFNNKYITDKIKKNYPDSRIKRRNSGYALDILLDNDIFNDSIEPFNFCKLLCGSEGTLAITTKIKLKLVDIHKGPKALLCAHFKSIAEALRANLLALETKPAAIELIDKTIISLAAKNTKQIQNQFFIKGLPEAILVIEYQEKNKEDIAKKQKSFKNKCAAEGIGYHFPLIDEKNISKVWDLRKAGLGVLQILPGDSKPVPVIEDTAILPKDLPKYIKEFQAILKKHKLEAVYYAHIATGELHLRPVLNLKKQKDINLFHTIGKEIAYLVKKYNGSLSGEHGDGRLRAEFLHIIYGKEIISIFKQIKKTWDPKNILNPGKIVNSPPMNTSLRFSAEQKTPSIKSYFSFEKELGFARSVEMCNGSADCRKSATLGGTMCPSYMATYDEDKTPRARANLIRELVVNSKNKKPFKQKEVFNILADCLSCKACKTECPSNVDIAKLKAEFLQHYFKNKLLSIQTLAIAYSPTINKITSYFSSFYNKLNNSSLTKKLLSMHKNRVLPNLSNDSLLRQIKKLKNLNKEPIKTVYFFADEITNYFDAKLGIIAINFLHKLGYKVLIAPVSISGRTFLSKGLLRKSRRIAQKNIQKCYPIISKNTPLVGIEPSTILTFRDEYIDLVDKELKNKAQAIAKNTLLIDEFICQELDNGNINPSSFTDSKKKIALHTHCYQKALNTRKYTKKMLSISKNHEINEIPSGCCGMAGSFGLEKKHYELSQKIGELVLFKEIRKSTEDTIIAAPGFSCRHQIKEGTNKRAVHPIEILSDALRY